MKGQSTNVRGQVVIIAICFVGVVLAVFSIWYLRQLRSQAVAFWGTEVALSIRDAPQVELLEIVPVERAAAGMPRISKGRFAIASRRPLIGKPGLIQMRLLLLDNGMFGFGKPPKSDVAWSKGLRFSGPKHEQTTLLFDISRGQLRHEETDRQVEVAQRKFLSHFLDEASGAQVEPRKAD